MSLLSMADGAEIENQFVQGGEDGISLPAELKGMDLEMDAVIEFRAWLDCLSWTLWDDALWPIRSLLADGAHLTLITPFPNKILHDDNFA